MNEFIGQPVDRVDGKLKVTGKATYSAEFDIPNLAYGVAVQSTIPKGHIRVLDTRMAEKAPGVIGVMTYKNAMQLHFPQGSDPGSGKFGEKDLLPLQSERIFYDGQHIAIVLAETFEQAEHAAKLVYVAYDTAKPAIDINANLDQAFQPKQALGGAEVQKKQGDTTNALNASAVKLSQTYSTPVYHHNAMEPHATIAVWNDKQLTVYDSTQSVYGTKMLLSGLLGIPPENVRTISLFIGGGFGSKGFSWAHTVLAPMAAKFAGRPVKIVLSRQQMFTSNGRRSETIQKIDLGTATDGKLNALRHATTSETSFVDDFVETAGVSSKMLYQSPNIDVTQNVVRLNRGTPCPMRAPGEAPGTYAFEVAMDELAYQLNIDPVQLRLINYAETNPENGKLWSEKSLRECYEQGAAAIGWSQRNTKPGSMREGNYLVGYGMATATYPGNRGNSTVKVQLFSDGHAEALCCTQDIGTGTYTIMTQIVAQTLGLPIDKVTVKLGDTLYPKGANSGGSQTAASVGPPMRAAALGAMTKVIEMAVADNASPLHGHKPEDIVIDSGRIVVKGNPDKGEAYSQVMVRNGQMKVEAEATTNVSTRETQTQEANPAAKANDGGTAEESKKNPAVTADEQTDRKPYAFHSFGAHFVKVLVDPELGMIKVDKIVGVMDIGTVLNMKTAKNQIMGGMIFGIGMALMEHTQYDPNRSRVVTRDLANYLVPVHADMPEFDVRFINKPDTLISPLGARGIGEIGITGVTAAIANAIYHATGKRVRDLPITPDKLI